LTTRYYDYIVNKISAAKKTADDLAKEVGHHGLEGQIRELALKECVEPFLTHSFQCSSGKMIDIFQSQSDQIDLIVYQTKAAPPILINKDLGFFPVECCRYAFEVKSTLTASQIKDAIKKFKSLWPLKSYPKRQDDGSIEDGGPRPVAVLFAFDSDVSGSEITRFLKYESSVHPACTVLCVLGKGYWFFHGGRWHGFAADENEPYSEFCGFITGFMNTLAAEETAMRPFSPGGYMRAEDQRVMPVSDVESGT